MSMTQSAQTGKTYTIAEHDSQSCARKRYLSPELTVYGSVRNLTGGSLGNGLDGNGTHTKKSDRRLKENVVSVGRHPAGFSLYLFDYKEQFRDTCGHGRQFGVMADEVASICPDAVSTGSDGYSQVDYGRLGISLH